MDRETIVGLGGQFAATERGQPMEVYGFDGPFFPLDPRPEDISLEAIAHALSLQCRYGGHCKTFYSVAEHCIRVSEICPNYPREGLLHDASEAFLGDIIRPLKVLFPLYKEAEERMERIIAERFELEYPWPDEVKAADQILLSTEKRDLMGEGQDWGPLPEPLINTIEPMSFRDARYLFLMITKRMGL